MVAMGRTTKQERERARQEMLRHARSMLTIWVMGRLEDAIAEGMELEQESAYELNEVSKPMYELMKYRRDCIPSRENVIATLQALGITERAEQVADVLRAM